MTTFIIILIVAIIVVSVIANNQKPKTTNTLTEDELRKELIKSITDNIKITVTTNTSNHRDKRYDSSIVDVSNETHPIIYSEVDSGLTKYPDGVPSWSHQYVYSASALDYATKEQQRFYFTYKSNFLSGVCLDIEDNSNYAFILLFDLFNDYEDHKDLGKLKTQVKLLGEAYPKTKSYGTSFLVELIRKKITLTPTNSDDRDALFDEAAKIVIESQQGSTSLIQRKLSIGFNRAGRIMDQLEQAGIVSAFSDGYSRKVLVTKISQIKSTQHIEVEDSLVRDFPDYHWSLNQKYGEKLGISEHDRDILNNLWFSGSGFSKINFFQEEIIKLFFVSLNQLKNHYIEQNTTLEEQFTVLSDMIARKHYRYRNGSQNYNNYLQNSANDIYSNMFRMSENAIREHCNYKRKLDIYILSSNYEYIDSFGVNIFNKFNSLLLENSSSINKLSPEIEEELNSMVTTRWKIEFAEILAQIDSLSSNEYLNKTLELGRLNKKNPSLENIYYEASKQIAKKDKTISLMLYIYYIDADLKSATFDNKQITKTIQKSLFNNQEQITEFESIISDFIATKDINAAIETVANFYVPKRKKISIDTAQIKEVQSQHTQTVELLNEYLQDDEEIGNTITLISYNDEISIQVKTEEVKTNLLSIVDGITLNDIQLQTLNLFHRSNLSVEAIELTDFAKEKGYFTNQLVESINEVCYELLNDVLIEEDGDYYTINEDYYKNIVKQ